MKKIFSKKNKNRNIKTLAIIFVLFLCVYFLGADIAYATEKEAGITFKNILSNPIDAILLAIFKVVGWLFGVAGVFFAWIVDPINITAIIDSSAVRNVWTTVRDFLNMFFILVLLFSAFATIFQIDKYNIKRILLKLVLMALLVNFSFPIARFIIDVSNVIMYHFLNNMFVAEGSGFGSTFGAFSNITKVLTPETLDGEGTAAYLLVSIAFVFLLGISVLVIGVLLLIRVIVLAILVMFSPIGFVGNIFPGFEKFSSNWWDALFKHAFSGPILVFFVAISLMMMEAVKNNNNFASYANSQSAGAAQGSYLANLAFTIVPLIMIWVGIGSAQKTGAVGGAAVGKFGQSMSKKISGFNYLKRNYSDFKKERDKLKEGKSFGSKFGESGGKLDQKLQNLNVPGARKAKERVAKKNLKDRREEIDNKSKDAEGKSTADISSKIMENTFGKDSNGNIELNPDGSVKIKDISNLSKDEAIGIAGDSKQAAKRGSEFEKTIKENVKDLVNSGKLKDMSPMPQNNPGPSFIPPVEDKSKYANVPKLTPNASLSEVENRKDIIRENEKKKREYEKEVERARDIYEKQKNEYEKALKKREEDFIQKQTAAIIKQSREIIRHAEDVK